MGFINFDFWLADGALLYALKDLSFRGRCLVDWTMQGSEKAEWEITSFSHRAVSYSIVG